jgi:hypothetical protein
MTMIYALPIVPTCANSLHYMMDPIRVFEDNLY